MLTVRQCALRLGSSRVVAATLAAGLAVSGCAYFNTFYHARKYYREAEAVRLQALEQGKDPRETSGLYEKSIKKCAKLIVEYPNSKWVDDALLLMGNGFFYQGEYGRALRKYDELVTYYPQSPFVDDARWMTGRSEFELGTMERARAIFRKIAKTHREPARREEARIMIARSWQMDGDYGRCIEEIEALIAASEGRSAGPGAYMVLGDCHRASGDCGLARSMFEAAATLSTGRVGKFEARLKAADCLKEMGQLDEARQVYARLLERETNAVRMAKLRLATARLLIRSGEVEKGIEMLEVVAEDGEAGDLAGEAQFEIGQAYERDLGELESAIEAYGLVDRKRPTKETSKRAALRREMLNRLVVHLERKGRAAPDSVAEVDFTIAEHYLFEMEEPAQALEHYREVVSSGTDEALAAKSLLAIAWIREAVDRDSALAAEAYEDLVERYPDTEYADRAREVLGLPPRPVPEPADSLATGRAAELAVEEATGESPGTTPDGLTVPAHADSAAAGPPADVPTEPDVEEDLPGAVPDRGEPEARPDSLGANAGRAAGDRADTLETSPDVPADSLSADVESRDAPALPRPSEDENAAERPDSM